MRIKLPLEKIRGSRWAKWPAIIVPIFGLLILGGLLVNGYRTYERRTTKSVVPAPGKKTVKVIPLNQLASAGELTIEGTVKPATRVDVVALTSGTVRQIVAKVGDRVALNQPLVFLHDDITLTNLNNASNNYNNVAQNFSTTRQLTDEGIKQAELGLERARETVASAEIGLKSAQDNYNNGLALQNKGREDLKNNAVTNYYSYLNTINTALTQCNFIIKADGSSQLEGISPTLSVRNPQALTDAKNDYAAAKEKYDALLLAEVTPENATQAVRRAVEGLKSAQRLVDDTVLVLDNTISSNTFSESALNGQRSGFAALRATLIGALTGAQSFLQTLENLDLNYKQQLDALDNGKRSAENQLAQAKIGYDNALATLSATKKSSSQQQTISQITLDNARGQLSIISTQAGDLTVKAPIAGQLTARTVEVGTEVRIGQKVAEVSQADSVKIILGLSPEDANAIKLGEKVKINSKLEGTVNQIDPAADQASKKIKVEVLFDNSKKELIPETLVTVALPISRAAAGKNILVLPLDAVTISQNENYIFMVADGKAKKTVVELEQIEGDRATVKAELNSGEQVVVEGNKLLEEGDLVEIKN